MTKNNHRRKVFRDAKKAGITAEEVFQMVLKRCRENKGPHSPAENAMNIADALDEIRIVFGKSA
jgi:hypothetical protein